MVASAAAPAAGWREIVASRLHLTLQLIRREIVGRYRGSALGILWSLITPLLMLAVYTFVFGSVFKARWTGAGAGDGGSMADFAITLFAGLTVFQIFGEVIPRAPTLILSNPSYVKKVVFPLEILAPVALGSALFHAGVSLVVLLGFQILYQGHIALTAPLVLIVIAPYALLILGLSWFLASIGVFWRDVGQLLGTVVTALMFLSPIFYPLSALPEWLQPWLALNPIALPVEEARNLLIFGKLPDFAALSAYSTAAMLVAWLGYLWFQKTRRGFADVL
jgi:lipopolysaccharide transport system permease protein